MAAPWAFILAFLALGAAILLSPHWVIAVLLAVSIVAMVYWTRAQLGRAADERRELREAAHELHGTVRKQVRKDMRALMRMLGGRRDE